MKKIVFSIIGVGLAVTLLSYINKPNSTLTSNFVTGNPEVASINAISFGPQGILFLGDSKNATIYALDTKDTKAKNASEVDMINFDTKLAASLGTSAENIKITDMAVNPISKAIYFSVNSADGTPLLMALKDGKFENISLKNISYSKIELVDAVEDKKDDRGRDQRVWAIADLKYYKGRVMVSGLSNKEFSSTFRSMPFPFTNNQDYASLEMYHAAHGRYETYSPIKTFDVVNIDKKEYLLASYTCTPLVLFPMDELKGTNHVKGRTIAEIGAGNTPLDMIAMEKDGKSYVLMANTRHSTVKFDFESIASTKESLTEKVEGTDGITFEALADMKDVVQLDNLDTKNIAYLQKTADGTLALKSSSI